MTSETRILNLLVDIVGKDFASNQPEELYMYSRDGGSSESRRVDYVVMPKTTEQVQKIIILANQERIPIIPMGGGLTLSGLVIPVHGGIVLDMKRMDSIIEVNKFNRYVIIEAGVSEGRLKSYLERHYPEMQHSIPEAPPIATVVGNALIRGHGNLTMRYGNNAHMINGMEVVLPTGEVCKIGSCSVSPYWFGKGPLPDLTGLFVGWFGTTGIVTKLSFKLYPKPKMADIAVFSMENPDLLPDTLYKITQTGIVDNLFIAGQEKPEWMAGHQYVPITITGESEEDIEYKRNIFKKLARQCGDRKNKIDFMEEIPPSFKERFLTSPPFAAVAADFRKGGGFQYAGVILPIAKVPEAWRKGIEIAHKYGMICSYVHQVLGASHSVMFGFNYSFNRADEEDIQRVRDAMNDSNKLTLELGGIPWKAELKAQKQIIERMDPNTFQLMKKIKKILDPNEIMNPGNWSD